VVKLELILQKDLHYLREDHDSRTPFPFDGSVLPKIKKRSKNGRDISPSVNEPSSVRNLKLVSTLALQSLSTFPVLMTLDVDQDTVRSFLQDLIAAKHINTALKYDLSPLQSNFYLYEFTYFSSEWPHTTRTELSCQIFFK
jgi:hypothetical protein